MNSITKISGTFRSKILLAILLLSLLFPVVNGQNFQTIVFDISHGQSSRNGEVFNSLLPENSGAEILINSGELNDTILQNKKGLILFSPTKAFLESEKQVIVKYLHLGGSLLLIFDEERRTPLNTVGVNDFISPFEMELTDDVPVRHNCGAIADSGEICSAKWELPYSGGRSIKGGIIISRVFDEGDYIHCTYRQLPEGGKIIVMSDGMAGLLLGRPDGERFSGTNPSDSKYWGKDSRIFMEEVLAFFIRD